MQRVTGISRRSLTPEVGFEGTKLVRHSAGKPQNFYIETYGSLKEPLRDIRVRIEQGQKKHKCLSGAVARQALPNSTLKPSDF
jgi:hypothetical protein